MTRELLLRYFETSGVPAAIYNVAGANRSVAQALTTVCRERDVIFVGHELSVHSRALLEAGAMDYVISHDFADELRAACKLIRDYHHGSALQSALTPIMIQTRHNCA